MFRRENEKMSLQTRGVSPEARKLGRKGGLFQA